MLQLDDTERLNAIIQSQQQVGGYTDYLNTALKPAIARGNWDELEKMPIGYDDNGEPLGCFKDDEWHLTEYFHPNQNKKTRTITFTVDDKVLERNIKNELKVLILRMLWLSPKLYSLEVCYTTLTALRKYAVALLEEGVNSFSNLSFEMMEEWSTIGSGILDFEFQKTYSSINKIIVERAGLPFVVGLQNTLTAKDFNLTIKAQKQYVVVPPRLYFNTLNLSTDVVENIYAYRDELAELSQAMVQYEQGLLERYAKYIYKKKKPVRLHDRDKKGGEFEKAFYDMDSPSQQDVLELVRKHRPSFSRDFEGSIANLRFNGKTLTLIEAQALLSDYAEHCKFLGLALTGMRIDELHALHWHQGIDEDTIDGQRIYALRADMSKITGNTQARQDTFVTTDVGRKAYEVLNDIMIPLRNTHSISKQAFFHSFETGFKPIQKDAVSASFMRWFERTFSDALTLNAEDMKYLNISDPTQDKYKLDDDFTVSPHQLRRSFAYYLIGYELLSFPQLKQQFSHFSIAMTRYYAKNASKFQKWRKTTYDEINDERVTQQAQIYLDIYQKLANNERVAGGKGKEFAKQMLKRDKGNQFTDKTENDMLSQRYWENAIRKKKRHLHVVAPGVICTSTGCSMRTSVSFLDCVECDNDYVIDAVFAEANRKEAEINMLYDIEHNELTPSSATESYKKIQAAQRIMDDLGVEYDPVVYPPEVKGILIEFVEV